MRTEWKFLFETNQIREEMGFTWAFKRSLQWANSECGRSVTPVRPGLNQFIIGFLPDPILIDSSALAISPPIFPIRLEQKKFENEMEFQPRISSPLTIP